jgi:hypothetical protein
MLATPSLAAQPLAAQSLASPSLAAPPLAAQSLARRSLARRSRRRLALSRAAGLAAALRTLELTARLAWVPDRPAVADSAPVPDIQFDIDRYVPPARLIDGIEVRFGPTHTVFATARLARTPSRGDQHVLGEALATIEATYPSHPAGVLVHVAYGRPYFDRLPPGLVALHMPRLLSNTGRFALEEAVADPAVGDPAAHDPAVPAAHDPAVPAAHDPAVPAAHDPAVRIEHNDLLFTLRGDDPRRLADTLAWLGGSDRLAGRHVASPRYRSGFVFTSSRAMFAQLGLPRKVATARGLPYQALIHPRSQRWMGIVDHLTEPGAPAAAVTCQGIEGVRLTTARAGDYFDNAAVQHLSHEILDLQRFYDVEDDVYLERVRDLYRTPPPLARHVQAAARAARAVQGRPLHQRLDGPGFDSMDVPDGTHQPKLQFSMFVPTADHFQRIRDELAGHAGLERFVTPTRRQNFLVPPRRHRSFPLLELT